MYCESLKIVIAFVAVAIPFYVAPSVRGLLRASRARANASEPAAGIVSGEPRLRLPLLETLVNRAFALRDRKLCGLLQEFLQPGARVCDVGCGDGSLLERLEKNGFDAYGLDIDINMVAKARTRVEPAKVLHSELSAFQAHATYDVILFCDSIRYMLQPHNVLSDALGLAGLVVITEPYEIWHRVGRVLFLRFLFRVDHLSTLRLRSWPVVARRRTFFHQFWVLQGQPRGGSIDWLAEEITKETMWMVNSLMHPALEARLKTIGAINLTAGIVALISLLLYLMTC
jgi:SAM-dependent methyltransferase